MLVDKSFMVMLRKEAKALYGGTKHEFDIQTCDGMIDSDGQDDDSEIDHIDLAIGTDLPDAKMIDVQVYGNHGGYEGDKLGYIYLCVEQGQVTRTWT